MRELEIQGRGGLPWLIDAEIIDMATTAHRADFGTRRMRRKLLELAVADFRYGVEVVENKRRRFVGEKNQLSVFRDAVAWLLDFDAEGPTSLTAVTESLGIDPAVMVERLGVARYASYAQAMDWGDEPRPCEVCGESYTPTGNGQKYCSPKCTREVQRARDRARPQRGGRGEGWTVYAGKCATCSKGFQSVRRYAKYCSGRCQKKGRRARENQAPVPTGGMAAA